MYKHGFIKHTCAVVDGTANASVYRQGISILSLSLIVASVSGWLWIMLKQYKKGA